MNHSLLAMSVAPDAEAEKSAPQDPNGTTATTRSCGSCTICCSGALRLKVKGHAIEPGKPCPYSSGAACTIYSDRPDVCRAFVCGWLRDDSPLPAQYRPDKIGIIVIFARFRWRTFPVDLAIATEENIDQHAKNWLERFCYERKRPLIFQQGGLCYAYGPAQFRVEIAELLRCNQQQW